MGLAIIVGSGGGDILSADMTAKKENVLNAKTFVGFDTNDEIAAGTMPDKTGWSSSGLLCGKSVTIPKGYHDGTKTVAAASLASQTGVDSGKTAAAEAQITNGYMAWVNGVKVIGTRATFANETKPDSGKSAIIATVIPTGFQGFVNGSKVTGSAADYRTKTTTSNAVIGSYSSGASGYVYVKTPAGLYSANTLVRAVITNLTPSNIKAGVTIAGVQGTWEGYVNDEYNLYKAGTVSSDIGMWNSDTYVPSSGYSAAVSFASSYIQFSLAARYSTYNPYAEIESNNYLRVSNYNYINIEFTPSSIAWNDGSTGEYNYIQIQCNHNGSSNTYASRTYYRSDLVAGRKYTFKCVPKDAERKLIIRFTVHGRGDSNNIEATLRINRIYYSMV